MKIEPQNESLIFSSTLLPDIFFTEYLPQMSGDCMKVYFYILFLSKNDSEIKINDLSKKLSLNIDIIDSSIKYLEEHNLLLRKEYGFQIYNIQEIELNKTYKPKVTISSEDLQKTEESKARAAIIDTINNQFFQGVMSPSWYTDIELWYKKYGFDDGVMMALFTYCYDKSALHKNYVSAVADSWSKNNIKTYNDLDNYYVKKEKISSLASSIKKKLRLSRNLTEFEEEYLEKWNITFNYDYKIIEVALKKASNNYNLNFEYIDKLLSDWHEHGFKDPEQISNYLINEKNKPIQSSFVNKKVTPTKNKTSQIDDSNKRKYNNFNSFYSN